MKNNRLLFILLSIFITIPNLYAVKAYPYPITVTQPDGSELTIQLHGDEFFSYKTTSDGYLISRKNGIYNYAKVDSDGLITPTNTRASNVNKRKAEEKKVLAQLVTADKMKLKSSTVASSRSRIASAESSTAYKQSFPLSGSPKSIVILVNFTDTSFVTPNPKTAFTNLLNEQGYKTNSGTGSARDYFRDNSTSKFDPIFDVVGPFNLPNKMSYYGENDGNDDKNPRQMVIDACKAASVSGVDFSQYDTDNDGYVDNVFIYYAGYNEAEGGPDNSVWPHRWDLGSTGTRFNGKIISDYACTSELRSRVGTTMCGIGTFVHEFGHVLGLPDLYNTEGDVSYQTSSYWDVMDAGPYLNAGRTPPSYSAYERFYLNWLTPTELKTSGSYTLEPLNTNNKAYLISQYGNHNLNGSNPTPVEFFLMENRQKTGWDSYLPGHGMMVTQIYYNASDWTNNKPNNNKLAMGIDIIEADGNASAGTLATDLFPYTLSSPYITSFTPTLRSGVKLTDKTLSLITETGTNINFNFVKTETQSTKAPTVKEATDITTGSFNANWASSTGASGYYLTTYTLSNGTSEMSEGFDNGLTAPIGWAINATKTSTSSGYIGIKAPSIQFSNNNDSIETCEYIVPASKLSFYIRTLDATSGYLRVQGKTASGWKTIDSILISSSTNKTISKILSISDSYTKFKLTYNKLNGSICIDDITVGFDKKLEFIAKEKWVTTLADTMMNLKPETNYYYKVRATKRILNSDQSVLSETYSEFSNIVEVTTLKVSTGNTFRVIDNNTIQVLVPTTNIIVRVYNVMGQLIKTIIPTHTIFPITDLPKGQIYIIQAGDQRVKILL